MLRTLFFLAGLQVGLEGSGSAPVGPERKPQHPSGPEMQMHFGASEVMRGHRSGTGVFDDISARLQVATGRELVRDLS